MSSDGGEERILQLVGEASCKLAPCGHTLGLHALGYGFGIRSVALIIALPLAA